MAGRGSSKEYYLEFHQVGQYIKVSAIDPDTLTEVSIVGDPNTDRKRLEQLAVQKLEWVLAKKG